MKKTVIQIIISFIIIIFFLGILYQIYIYSMEDLAVEYTERQVVLTRQAASGIKGYFGNLKQMMKVINSVPEIKELKLKDKHFEEIIYTCFQTLNQQGIENLLIIDKNGICRWQAENNNFLGHDFSSTEPFKMLQTTKPSQFYMSDLGKQDV